MNTVERAEGLVKKHLGLSPPWERALGLRAFEYVLKHMPEIVLYLDGGLDAIRDEVRRTNIKRHLGERNGTPVEEYNFNVWLADKCFGPTVNPSDLALMRCQSCLRLRTHKNMDRLCKCGGNRQNSSIPTDLNTRMVMKAVVMGR